MSDDDPFLWLEEIEGEAALAWVARQNARTLAALESDPRFDGFYRAALDVLTAADRIPYPAFRGDRLANFWQDETHVRGLWRETRLASFLTAEPAWRTLLDIDALSAGEERNWVFQGAASLPPEYSRAWSACRMAARTRPKSGNSISPPPNSSVVDFSCPRASRALSGSTPTPSSSRAIGDLER